MTTAREGAGDDARTGNGGRGGVRGGNGGECENNVRWVYLVTGEGLGAGEWREMRVRDGRWER